MSKLSRRQFLKVAASLTASGALAWKGDSLPVIGAGKAIEGDDSTVYTIYDENGELILDDDDSVLEEQPFMPYYLYPYSSRVEVPFYKG